MEVPVVSEMPRRPQQPRKRPRRPETWKHSVAKAKRPRGEEYVSPSTGKKVPACTGIPSSCCKRCVQLLNREEMRF